MATDSDSVKAEDLFAQLGTKVSLENVGGKDIITATEEEDNLARHCVLFSTLLTQHGEILSVSVEDAQKEVMTSKYLAELKAGMAYAKKSKAAGLGGFTRAVYKEAQKRLLKKEAAGFPKERAVGMYCGRIVKAAVEVCKDEELAKRVFGFAKKKKTG